MLGVDETPEPDDDDEPQPVAEPAEDKKVQEILEFDEQVWKVSASRRLQSHHR